MLEKILRFAIAQRWLMLAFTLALVAIGIWSFRQLPIDATPDITNVQVQINTEAPGFSPLEVEQRVTWPIETAMAGLPGLDYSRSISRYGLSQVTVVFKDGTNLYFARQQVAERVQRVTSQLPEDLEPEMGPIATGLGEIFMYTVDARQDARKPDGAPWTATDLRTLQDWVVRPQLRNTPGVTEVNTIGGYVRQVHITPDPARMVALDFTLHDVVRAVAANNRNVGAGYIERNGQQFLVRAPGQVPDLEAIRDIVLDRRDGLPIRVRDVAEVGEGPELRNGAATQNGREVVLGTVFMLVGANSHEVARAAAATLEQANRSLPAGVRATPVYDRMQAENPLWGDYCGLEHALWYAPKGTPAEEEVTFRRSSAHAHVGAECRAVRDAVGHIEISNYGKFEVTGRDAERWLATIMANKVPAVGRVVLTPMLNERGRLIGDFTMCRISPERFLLVGTYAAERFYQRWFEARMGGFDVQVRACAMEWLGFSVAGPASRELLQSLVDEDLGTKAFPFMSFGAMDVGLVPALVGRLSFTGDLGYEIWVKNEYQRELYDRLVEAGKPLGLRHFGGRALNAMRMEKSFGSWAREFRPIYGPFEAGLDRFVDLTKPEFVGRAAALAEKTGGGERKLITLEIDATDCDAIADEPIWLDGKVVGWVTSGAYGHSVGK